MKKGPKGPKDPLDVTNTILEQVLGYFDINPDKLQMEGILRIDGNVAQQKVVLERVQANPVKTPIMARKNLNTLGKDGRVKLELTHNIIGVLKKSLKEPLGFSPQAIEVIKQFDKNTSNNIVEELIKVNALAEAKMIHNLLHLGFLVAKNQKENKMTPNNVAVVLTPQIANITGEFAMGFSPVLKDNLRLFLEKELAEEKSLLSQPFDKEGYELQMAAANTDSHSSDSVSEQSSRSTTPRLAHPSEARPRDLQFTKSAEKAQEERVDPKWEYARYKDLDITDSSDISDIEDDNDNQPEDLEDVKPNPLMKKKPGA